MSKTEIAKRKGMTDAVLVRHLFDYNEAEGKLVRKYSYGDWKVGDFVGRSVKERHTDLVYTLMSFRGKGTTGAHRVIWLWMYGVWPTIIDHIDHDGENNKRNNLREVTAGLNNRNRRRHGGTKEGRHRGVIPKGNRWNMMYYDNNGKYCYGGSFVLESDAILARVEKERELGGYTSSHGS